MPQDVDAYIAEMPKAVRKTLTDLRRVIKKSAPKATERMSYGMPFYGYGGTGYKGRLIYFSVFKKHISVFILFLVRPISQHTAYQGFSTRCV